MRRSWVSEQERRLEEERCLNYRGTARVRLEVLYFKWDEPRELKRKNVERLKDIFQGSKIKYQDIHRLDPRNHIPAEIRQSDLDNALMASNVSKEGLLSNHGYDPPMLKFAAGYRLRCLHGQHRIQAAREVLPPTEAWWTVDLFLLDADPKLRTILVEEYSNEKKPSDGEIYRKIRKYEREGNICFKRRWKAFLSDHGRRGLQQLYNHGELAAAFDKLLDIPGLWDGMRISTLHKLINMKCDEEALHYLEHLRKTFYRIFNKVLHIDKAALQRVDQATVKAFELKAPKYSKRDAQVLEGQMLSGQICSLFSQQEREAIWDELRSTEGLIPSLSTFFEDLKYLRACADCLKRLVKVSRTDTVRTAFEHKFPYAEAGEQYVVEVAESIFVDKSGQVVDRFDLAYRHMWAFAMRNYREMPPDAKKKGKDLLAKAGVQRADEQVLSEFATLADRVGFESDEIQALKQRSSDKEIARNALLKARKPNRYQYDQSVLHANVAQIVRLFTTASPLPYEYSRPTPVCDNPTAAGKRCGFPDEDAQQQDRNFLFIPHLHSESDKYGEEITSFFVRQSVYFAFFGRSPDVGTETFGVNQPEQQEQERAEREKLQQERREQQRLYQETEQERREQERFEQERLERWRLERLERQRLEQERLDLRAIEERLQQAEAQERAEALQAQEKERLIQRQQQMERQEQEMQVEESQRQERREQGRREQEKTTESRGDRELEAANSIKPRSMIRQDSTPLDQETLKSVCIKFKIRETGAWRTDQTVFVNSSNQKTVERAAVKYMRKMKPIRVYDTDLNILTPQMCFQAAVSNRRNMLLLIPEKETDITEELQASVSQLLSESDTRQRSPSSDTL